MSERLIFTDLSANNNKFWHGHVEGTTCKTNWGRVGDTGQFKDYPFGSASAAEAKLQSLVSSKLKKGYTRQHTVVNGEVKNATGNKGNLGHIAHTQIQSAGDSETKALIDFLVQRNIHRIEGTTSIRIQDGKFTTPLGPVTLEGLDEAQALLDAMAVKGANLSFLANQYLRIIPKAFGRQRIEPASLFGTVEQLASERDTIDALRAVMTDAVVDTKVGQVFQASLVLISNDSPEFAKLVKAFNSTKNAMHAASSLRLNKAWKMKIQTAEDSFNASLGNIKELWHGTKDSNLLSLLKSGFIIPSRSQGIAIAGRMFGDGVYFSDQSTKALNYATASAPGQYGHGASVRKFMIHAAIAMGKEYHPPHSFGGLPPKGYDSTFVRGGTAGVRNNEMIVYNTNQICPKFLCEFV